MLVTLALDMTTDVQCKDDSVKYLHGDCLNEQSHLVNFHQLSAHLTNKTQTNKHTCCLEVWWGGLVRRSSGEVWRSSGEVWRSGGLVGRSGGVVRRSSGEVWRSSGKVWRSSGEVWRSSEEV